MKTLTTILLLLLVAKPALAAEEVNFVTEDGVGIYGDLHRSNSDSDSPLILLFHQAGGDARGEYGPLIPRLLEAGFDALAIDQRSGGDRFGGVNRTLLGVEGREFAYCDVYPDLEATLKQTSTLGYTEKMAVWGSSYSAALVFQLAHKNPDDVGAVLAFSPASGGPLADCAPSLYSAELEMPVLALRPAREMEIESVAAQLERLGSEGHQTYVSDPGVHGSSMLNAERVGASTDETWNVVLEFLRNHLD